MATRIPSDTNLQRMKYAPLADDFRNALKEWAKADDVASGLEPMTAEVRKSIREEVRFGHYWLRGLDRAIQLQLPEAAACCAFNLSSLLASLRLYVDAYPRHNRLVAPAQVGFKRATDTRRGAAKTNKKATKKAKNLDKKIKEDVDNYLREHPKAPKGIAYRFVADNLIPHISERRVRSVFSKPKQSRKSPEIR